MRYPDDTTQMSHPLGLCARLRGRQKCREMVGKRGKFRRTCKRAHMWNAKSSKATLNTASFNASFFMLGEDLLSCPFCASMAFKCAIIPRHTHGTARPLARPAQLGALIHRIWVSQCLPVLIESPRACCRENSTFAAPNFQGRSPDQQINSPFSS